jgi:hypothetical protein
MKKETEATTEEKMEDSLYYQSELSAELLKKVMERDAMIAAQAENIALLKRQITLHEIIFSKTYEFFSQQQQLMNLTAQEAKKHRA